MVLRFALSPIGAWVGRSLERVDRVDLAARARSCRRTSRAPKLPAVTPAMPKPQPKSRTLRPGEDATPHPLRHGVTHPGLIHKCEGATIGLSTILGIDEMGLYGHPKWMKRANEIRARHKKSHTVLKSHLMCFWHPISRVHSH